MKVLIIDQNAEAAAELSRLLNLLDPLIEILAVIGSVEEGVRWFISKPGCDLIFIDVILPDGSCFDIFREVKVNTPVIFTSTSPEFALKAFRLNSIDYLLKPIEKNGLISALYKFQILKEQFTSGIAFPDKEGNRLNVHLTPAFKSRFVITLGDKIKYINSEDIAWFRADGNLVYISTFEKSTYIVDQSLEEITDTVDPALFFRINRTFICQIKAISEIRKYFNSRLKIYLVPEPDEDEVLVSRNRVQEFLSWLGN